MGTYRQNLERHILAIHKGHVPSSQPCAAASSQESSSFDFNVAYVDESGSRFRDGAQLPASAFNGGATHNFPPGEPYAVGAGVSQPPLLQPQSYAASFQAPPSMNPWAIDTEESGRDVPLPSPHVPHGGAASNQPSASFHDESFSVPRYDPFREHSAEQLHPEDGNLPLCSALLHGGVTDNFLPAGSYAAADVGLQLPPPTIAGEQHPSLRKYLRGRLRQRREGVVAAGGLQNPQSPLSLQATAAGNRGLRATEDSFLEEPSPKRVRANSPLQSALFNGGPNSPSSLFPHFCEAAGRAEQPSPPIPQDYRGTFLFSDGEEEEY